MKILMIIDRYVPLWGGAENQLKQLMPHLVDRGCQIVVLTRLWQECFPPEEIIDGVDVHRVGIPGTSFISTASYLLSVLAHGLKHRKSIDIIHTHGAAALGAVGSLLAYLTGARNIAKIASAGRVPELTQTLSGRFILSIFKRSHVILCLSNEIRGELKSVNVPDEQIVSIFNAVDTTRFKALSREEKASLRRHQGFDTAGPLVIFSGRLVPRKGPDVLVSAWPAVVAARPQARLLIIGSGKNQIDSMEDQLRRKVFDENIPNIFFLGDTTVPELYMGMADLFVLASYREGCPNVVLEAMACGLGIVACDIGGVDEVIIHERTGMLFPPGDVKRLAELLIYLIDHEQERQRLGRAARRHVEDCHALDKAADLYFQVYQNTLARDGRHKIYAAK